MATVASWVLSPSSARNTVKKVEISRENPSSARAVEPKRAGGLQTQPDPQRHHQQAGHEFKTLRRKRFCQPLTHEYANKAGGNQRQCSTDEHQHRRAGLGGSSVASCVLSPSSATKTVVKVLNSTAIKLRDSLLVCSLVNRTSCGLSALEPTHHPTATAIDAANLLVATGNGEAIELILGNIKQLPKTADPTEIRALVVNPAALTARLVMNTPAIGPNHGQVGALLLFAQGRQGVSTFVRSESATGATMLDAGPLQLLSAHD